MPVKLNILIAPLDWGLGHTTRSIPIVEALLKNGHTVSVAAEGISASLIRARFPGLEIIPLRGYRIRYSSKKYLFAAKIISQIPRIIRAIRREHAWLRDLLQTRHFDLLISDNRYGLYHAGLPAVIMTHQLQIKTNMGKAADRALQKRHYSLLEKFRECWVVDKPGPEGLSGILAHPGKLPRNARYIGLLSQLALYPVSAAKKSRENNILVLLSGPEPMRGIFGKKLLDQIRDAKSYSFTFIAGDLSGNIPEQLPEGLIYHNHLHTGALKETLQQAGLVICRSGYSTLMDLALMGKKALLVPTPGQPEQEYLARFLKRQGVAFFQKESDLDLIRDIPKALKYPGLADHAPDFHRLMKAGLDDLIKSLS